MKIKIWNYLALMLLLLMLFTAGCTGANTQLSPSPATTIIPSNVVSPTTPSVVIPTITPQEAYNLIQKSANNSDFVILDVRTPDEFNSGHIAGAVNIDYYSPEFRANISKLDKNKQYLVYCRTGIRAEDATSIMLDIGFKKVQNLIGGITQWIQGGYPTLK